MTSSRSSQPAKARELLPRQAGQELDPAQLVDGGGHVARAHRDTWPMGFLDGWRHCPRCAGDLRVEGGKATCTRCGYAVWANPVPGAQALVEQDRHVLLGRRP